MIDKQLKDLYLERWELLSEKLKNIVETSEYSIKPANPLLLTLKDETKFIEADIRIMIFGQETNSWGKEGFHNDINKTLKRYDDFFHEKGYWEYGKGFWNGVLLFLDKIHAKYPNKKIEFIWNNLIKIGKSNKRGKPPHYIRNIEKEHFNIINEEIEIINPNLILFLSGPNYDYILDKEIEGFDKEGKLEGFTPRKLLKFKFKEKIPCYRTYHPNYMWRSSNIHSYYGAIVNDLDIK